MSPAVIVWFRQDLRLFDNPALIQACQQGKILPIYILDDENAQPWQKGGAGRVWLHHALADLNQQLDGFLRVFKGNAHKILNNLCTNHPIKAVYWGRCYEPWRIARDKSIKEDLRAKGLEVKSFNHSLLWEPWEIRTKSDTPYKVFTPFYRKGCLSAPPPRPPVARPTNIEFYQGVQETSLQDLGLIPDGFDWNSPLCQHWDISEKGAQDILDDFLQDSIAHYKAGRDFPGLCQTSSLSPYLHFGQISPHQVWYNVHDFALNHGSESDCDLFCTQLAWREFSYSLLYYNPHLPDQPLQTKFQNFPWLNDATALRNWQKGQTGFPLIDAGMRELWQTGYMHNRVRMIVASFLVKNLMIPWQSGESWFWDCLFDADLANNSASWQWVAGCGADAAPYFRIFNPVTQSEKFDPNGTYIRKFVPELSALPNKYIHKPWLAQSDILKTAGIRLGENYPRPIVDLTVSRERALLAYKEL